ncbi:MAG: protein kinase [Methanoregula sp.]|jgi:parallel beta-helix repeat protein
MMPQSRFISTLTLALLLLLSVCGTPVAAAEHTVAPAGAEFVSVQEAVDWASSGDTIFVESGTYFETVTLNHRITLMGVDSGGGLPVIDVSGKGNGIDIRVDGCTVEHFVIRNGSLFTGIRVASSDNTLRKNTVRGFGEGISLISSQRSTIAGNNISDNGRAGIFLEGSVSNDIEYNSVTKNTVGISLDGFSLSNRINRNNFINNQNVLSKSATSQWNSVDTLSYTYLGQKQQSRMGNYWSDFRGKDRNGDGIGDAPYTITIGGNPKAVLESGQNIIDAFPLMDSTEYYTSVSVVPSSALTITPGKPGTSGINTTETTSVSTITTSPQRTVSPESPAGTNIPTGYLVLLAVLLVIGAGAGLFVMRRRNHEDLVPPPATGDVIPPAEGGPESPGEVTRTVRENGEPAGEPDGDATPDKVPLARQITDGLKTAITGLTRKTTQVARAGAAATVPLTTKAASVLRTVVADRSRSPGPANHVPRTAHPDNLEPPAITPAPEQKNYFPRELESKYTEINYVGRGGIAWVFSARRKTDGIIVAVKIPISFDETTGKCFLNEIAAWETLMHKNIVEVTAVNILPVPYVEMEFVPGSLEALEKPLPVWKAVHIVQGITAGLQYAHQHGFIHRDIKPHNILLTEDVVPKITDWGMSKVLAADVKKSSIAGFSLSYAAPEQVSPSEFGRTGEHTDIYQLGVVFYELVTGSIPFGGESIVEVGNSILRDEPTPPSEYNPDAEAVQKIILKCLEKDPARRYQSAGELLDALAGYLDEDEG